MNFLSKLLPRSQPAPHKSIATLGPGEFSIVRREDSPRGHRELIFQEAEISLISTSIEFFPQIKVIDLNKVEDAQSIEDDELGDLERENNNTYLVHPDIKLGYYLSNSRVAVAWQDADSDDGERFEFLCSDTVSKEALDKFDRASCEALYGQKYGKKAPPDAPDSLFEDLTHNYDKSAPATVKGESAESHLATAKEETTVKHGFSEGRTIIQAECDLCTYDSVQGVFISPKALQKVNVVILDQTRYEYFLEVRNDANAVLGTPVHDQLNQFVDASNAALIFNYESETNVIMSYLLRFRDQTTLYKFENALAIAQYERRNRQRWEDVSEQEQCYLIDALSGVSMKSEDQSKSLAGNEGDEDEEEEEDDDADMVDVESEDPTTLQDNEKNSALEVGHVNDRSYVLRGNKIGVFKNTDKDLLYSTTIGNVDIDPSRIMLHEQDRALVIQAQDDANRLFRMDLETGKIVDTWDTGRVINNFNPVSKFAQTTAETNLYGVVNQSIFRIDPRVNGGKVANDAEKSYKSKLGFSDIVTTAAGYLVVGNKKGELRLYDQLGKTARMLIPGLGEPFIGLDVSSDGRYILATCEKFLLLIETETATSSGFHKTPSKKERVRPRKLAITPENVVYMYQQSGKPLKFTTARFNTGLDSKEATIVTSTGPYLVIWNLASVLRGEINAYRIKKYTSDITSENFKFGTDQRVILTLEDDVNMVAKSALKSPDAVFKPKGK